MPELKIIKLSMFDGMELKQAKFEGQTFPEHFHDSYSIAIVEEGLEKLYYGKKEILVHSNAVVVANPYDIHAHGFFDSDPCKYRAVYIPADLINHIQRKYCLKHGKKIWFPQQLFDDTYLFQLILRFHLESSSAKISSLYEIGYYMITNYAQDAPEDEFRPIAAILDTSCFLREHLPTKLSIETTARRCGMDKFKFIRVFKKQTGLTPISYLLIHRIEKAKQMILTSIPLVQVALETGFYDQSHFIHYFRKYVGISPLEYKKNTTIY